MEETQTNTLQDLLTEGVMIRYSYYFESDITTESVQGLIDVLSMYPQVDLFITSPGGELHGMMVLIHFINNHPDIKIYLTGMAASAITYLFLYCTKEIILTQELDFILFHLIDRGTEGEFRKRTIDSKILYEQLKEYNDMISDKFKAIGLTSKEMKAYLAGEDVVLYRKDFKRLKINGNK